MEINTGQYPIMVLISYRGVITNLMVKMVYIALGNMYNTRGWLEAAVEYHIKLYDDICKSFTKGSM